MKDWKPKDIKNFRKRFKLSQSKLASLLGVSRNYIYLLESGEKIPSKTLKPLLSYVKNSMLKNN